MKNKNIVHMHNPVLLSYKGIEFMKPTGKELELETTILS